VSALKLPQSPQVCPTNSGLILMYTEPVNPCQASVNPRDCVTTM